MKVPGSPASSGCVTTPNSLHCRTELREIVPSSWSPNAGLNRLTVTLAVEEPDESSKGTVIGQIHIDDSISSKPGMSVFLSFCSGDVVFFIPQLSRLIDTNQFPLIVCELYYNSAGTIQMGVEFNSAGGDETFTTIGTIPGT